MASEKKNFFSLSGRGGMSSSDGRPPALSLHSSSSSSPAFGSCHGGGGVAKSPQAGLDRRGRGPLLHSGWGLIVELFGPFSPPLPHLSLSLSPFSSSFLAPCLSPNDGRHERAGRILLEFILQEENGWREKDFFPLEGSTKPVPPPPLIRAAAVATRRSWNSD